MAWRRIASTGHGPSAREGHTATALDENTLMVTGGKPFNQVDCKQQNIPVYFFDLPLLRWTRGIAEEPSPVDRCYHSVTKLSAHRSLLIGGKYIGEQPMVERNVWELRAEVRRRQPSDRSSMEGLFGVPEYSISWRKFEVLQMEPCLRHHVAVRTRDERLVLIGGCSDDSDRANVVVRALNLTRLRRKGRATTLDAVSCDGSGPPAGVYGHGAALIAGARKADAVLVFGGRVSKGRAEGRMTSSSKKVASASFKKFKEVIPSHWTVPQSLRKEEGDVALPIWVLSLDTYTWSSPRITLASDIVSPCFSFGFDAMTIEFKEGKREQRTGARDDDEERQRNFFEGRKGQSMDSSRRRSTTEEQTATQQLRIALVFGGSDGKELLSGMFALDLDEPKIAGKERPFMNKENPVNIRHLLFPNAGKDADEIRKEDQRFLYDMTVLAAQKEKELQTGIKASDDVEDLELWGPNCAPSLRKSYLSLSLF